MPDRQTNENKFIDTEKSKTATILLVITSSKTRLINQYLLLQTVICIVAYCLRLFKHRLSKNISSTITTADEIAQTLFALIYCVQLMVYADDIDRIKKEIKCSKKLRQLDPFIGDNGIIRVASR